MFRRSAKPAVCGTKASVLSAGTDSPVKADSSILRSRTFSSRRSAGTLSPDCSDTISPGTNSAAETRRRCPLRSTVASLGKPRANAAMAPIALDSCRNPTTALTTTTARITSASTSSLKTPVTMAAASSV